MHDFFIAGLFQIVETGKNPNGYQRWMDKQIVSLIPCETAILLSSKMKWTTYTCNNMDVSQNYAAELKKQIKVYTIWLPLYKILGNAN